MGNTIKQLFHSGKFVTGFSIMAVIIVMMIIYPLFNPGNPLEMIGLGSMQPPGTYVSLFDSINSETTTFKLPGADARRVASVLSDEDKVSITNYLLDQGVPANQIDMDDEAGLITGWFEKYDPANTLSYTKAKRNYFSRLNNKLMVAMRVADMTVTQPDSESGEPVTVRTVNTTDYVNVKKVANSVHLPLGTDNFGRDVLKELVSACGTSLLMGLVAGTIATILGLTLGLLSGYIGGIVDDIIIFITNIFTVIPGFVLLMLISYSIGQESRGAMTVALVIGLTSWTWTTRSVRSQVISLRNRDHVNLSKLSGHSLFRILCQDILPYIASYVVMAFILQISSAILAEAQLSMLGMGPKTTEKPTLGLMMNWAMLYAAHLNGYWWAYFPVLLTIALISFSLNLMNTGMDQVFNPALRD
ncbi:MAG: ABC transporter permease [Treponemataceae bacterium]|nr:ABC transporter permease [Treponemataceae bacterium]